MKLRKSRFLAMLLAVSMLVSLLTGMTAQAASDDPYDALIFDAEEAYQGEYTVTDQENVGGTIVFKTYQVTYVTKPITGLTWADAPSENYFKMNIKVPVSYNGAAFDQAAMADAPILFYNPWGGDRGAAVGDPGALASKGNTGSIIGRALSEGWVVVEPGMRGAANCFVGTPDEDDYVNYGKLPRPLADLKAAIRYLRYGTNESTIPGDKERIFVAGSSSGGSATVMLGASGNSSFFDPYLEEIGAAPGRDDIFAAMPSCPVMTRAWGDPAIAWERWGDLTGNKEANEINVALTQAFVEYQAELGLKAEFDVGDTIKKGDLLTADNYADYLMVYLKESALKFLNGLGGREAIEAYLAEDLAANSMYNTPDASRDWIDPIYDENNPDLVVDIGGTWEEFWAYVVGEDYFDPANLLDMQYERPITATDEMMAGNGVVNSLVGDRYSKYANASSFSFGKESDYAAVFSDFGQAWIQEERGIEISQEYLDLIELQRNSVDPLYFILGEGAEDATVCENWFMRTGSVDLVTPHPVFFNLATALENQGKNVDAALVWDQKHGLTSDLDGLFAFADALLARDAAEEEQALTFNPDTAYQGNYTTTYDGKEIEFEVYQATYVTNPITGYQWGREGSKAPSEDFFKLTINVPVSYNGVSFDKTEVDDAPILFFIPWSGDGGSAAPEPGTFISKGVVMTSRALAEGWVVVEPGMRGSNCTTGTPDTDDYYNFGKLPYPVVDLKAAVRYLRNGSNESTIPGNKDLIFASSSSSGGCGTVMLGASANNAFFDPYLEEMGAADASDAIFCAAPSCPVMDRGWGDVAIAWEVWGDLSDVEGANAYNVAMTAAFPDYLDSLNLKAEFDVDADGDGTAEIKAGDALTADNYADYLMVYLKESAVRFLNEQLGSKAAIDEYLSSIRAADRYGSGDETRTWIEPIYAPGTETVVDIGGTWEEFWTYCYGSNQIDPSVELNWQYDKTMTAPNLGENGILSAADSSYANLSSASFGKPSDYAAVLSQAGQAWIQEERGIEISQEYLDLIELQGHSVDPLYFAASDEAGHSDICDYWFMRSGATDLVCPLPLFFGLATALENQGKDVDAALMWDEMHQVTSDQDAFFDYAYAAIEEAFPGHQQSASSQTSFSDVDTSAWYADAVAYVTENGLMSGDGSGRFGVSDPLSRAMLAQILYNMEGRPAVSAASPFRDVAAGAWYTQAVVWAAQAQIVTGYDGAFTPDGNITREQLAVMLYRYAQTAGYDTAQGGMAIREYADYGAISDYALSAMDWAVSVGIITGNTASTLNPQGSATRAEVAVMLTRLAASETA